MKISSQTKVIRKSSFSLIHSTLEFFKLDYCKKTSDRCLAITKIAIFFQSYNFYSKTKVNRCNKSLTNKDIAFFST